MGQQAEVLRRRSRALAAMGLPPGGPSYCLSLFAGEC
eukprot:CAMPEP_0179320506 /NCGR_PEP_ID=MMETSP0797-20121207/58087_1 /TAXON_ID=47934 /ORGANISM="Dinophysis acuminata, Strain DAEP01" /LENGTH=36 /DNA_ID= /DNA_START= /DNA_END= /DNA_ORIENTATION=